jgi:hypothetical protein
VWVERSTHVLLVARQLSTSAIGSSIRHPAERAAEARKKADRLGCVASNQRMFGYKGHSPIER